MTGPTRTLAAERRTRLPTGDLTHVQQSYPRLARSRQPPERRAAFPLPTCGRPRLSPGPAAPTGGQRDPIRGRGQPSAAAAPPSPRTRRRSLTTAPQLLITSRIDARPLAHRPHITENMDPLRGKRPVHKLGHPCPSDSGHSHETQQTQPPRKKSRPTGRQGSHRPTRRRARTPHEFGENHDILAVQRRIPTTRHPAHRLQRRQTGDIAFRARKRGHRGKRRACSLTRGLHRLLDVRREPVVPLASLPSDDLQGDGAEGVLVPRGVTAHHGCDVRTATCHR